MKTLVTSFMSILMFVFLTTCDETHKDEFMAKGVISGFDLSKCGCCWGWVINLNNDSTELFTRDSRYIDHYPSNLVLNSSTVFPIFIWLDYTDSPANCGQAINITRFEYR